MDRVLVVLNPFEDFKIGDMIVEDEAAGSVLADEHRHRAVSVAVQAPIGAEPEEI